jgi:ribosomal protein L29
LESLNGLEELKEAYINLNFEKTMLDFKKAMSKKESYV